MTADVLDKGLGCKLFTAQFCSNTSILSQISNNLSATIDVSMEERCSNGTSRSLENCQKMLLTLNLEDANRVFYTGETSCFKNHNLLALKAGKSVYLRFTIS